MLDTKMQGEPSSLFSSTQTKTRHQKNHHPKFYHHQHQQHYHHHHHHQQQQPHSVSFILYKTLNSVLKSSRKILFRVCEVAGAKKSFNMFNLYSTMNRRNDDKEQKEIETTGHDRFCQERPSRSTYRKKKKKNVRRAQSVAEFETQSSTATAPSKRLLFRGRSVSTEQDSETEHSEKSPLVSAKLDSLAKLLFSRSLLQDNGNGSRECDSPTRHSTRYQYTALDSGLGASDRSPRERAARDRALTACQEWIGTGGRYEIIGHLDDIGSRPNKQWFLLNDTTVRTDRLMTLLPIPPDCVALEELPPSENPKGILMELLGSLQHPYIYPVLDLGFLNSDSHHYACLVMPFNPRGSLKDLIYKSQWNEPWNRKYTKKSTCLPISQVQRLGRQILEALLFLRERGFSSHGHLHSGNVILQNGVARLSGIENGLLGLNSRVNAVNWSRSDIDHIDVICFGHLLFEMCAGYELGSPQPSPAHLELELERYPQIAEVLAFIFDSPDSQYPSIEDLVLCDLFRNIDLREMRGTCVPSFKHGLSNSTLSLLQAVRRRQGGALISSHSEGSSPCTPPSTPRDRRPGEIETSDITSSDSDIALDEIVIEPSTSEFQYDPLNSPIHFCDNSVQSDESNSFACFTNLDELPSFIRSSSENTYMSLKNSKSRRMEYSKMRSGARDATKLTVSNNPSQDSAFGSMTDGDVSAASSFRLSSFQSISSPIDEGVEDLGVDNHLNIGTTRSSQSTPCSHNSLSPSAPNENHSRNTIRLSSDNNYDILKPPPPHSLPLPSATPIPRSKDSTSIFLELPTLLINDQKSIYTSSPSRKFGSSIEVFSQKYRVSSFEDMTARFNAKKIRQNNPITFRSFEEERQIDYAFMPVVTNHRNTKSSSNIISPQKHKRPVVFGQHREPENSAPPVAVNNHEKYKKLTHASFTNKVTSCASTRDKHILWKNSIISRKNNLIKSNESLLLADSSYAILKTRNTSGEESASPSPYKSIPKYIGRVQSINEISTKTKMEFFAEKFKKSKSDKILYPSNEDYRPFSSSASSYSIELQDTDDLIESSDDYDEDEEESIFTNTFMMSSSSSHSEARRTIGGMLVDPDPDGGSAGNSYSAKCYSSGNSVCSSGGGSNSREEKIPLLEGMEMSPITPPEESNEPDESL